MTTFRSPDEPRARDANGDLRLTMEETALLLLDWLRDRGAIVTVYPSGRFDLDLSDAGDLSPFDRDELEAVIRSVRSSLETILWSQQQEVH